MQIYLERLRKLQKSLLEENCDGLLIEDQINLYYLTGLFLSSGTLLIHPSGALLYVDNRYYEMCKKTSPFPVILTEGNRTLLDLLNAPEAAPLRNLAFSSDNTTYGGFLQLQKEIEEINRKKKLPLSLKALDNPVAKLRMIKDPSEVDTLREAANLGSEGYDFICALLKEGVTEAEIAAELEIFWKRRGSKAIAFDPIIAFGSNSSMPHYRVGSEKLKSGNSVLIDIGVNLKHYHSDMTRVVYFGKPDPKMLAIHEIVQKAQAAALEICRPHTLIGDLDKAARGCIEQNGFGEHFTHSLGHGVGLEIHEFPTLRNKPPYSQMPLREGMVITIEPGIYLPGIGGVRIEDTVVITSNGHENLTNRPKEPLFINIP